MASDAALTGRTTQPASCSGTSLSPTHAVSADPPLPSVHCRTEVQRSVALARDARASGAPPEALLTDRNAL